MKISLVLEGGGMRGAYTAGVLDCFNDQHIVFEDIIAVSAGLCMATSYVSKQRGRNIEILEKYSGDKRYLSMENMVKTGSVFGMDFIFRVIPNELLLFDLEAYLKSGVRLTGVCTNLTTAKPHYELIDHPQEKLDYIIASSSLPFVAKPVKVDNMKLLDGGAVDPIPIAYATNQDFDYHVVVLTRPEGYKKTKRLSTRLVSTRYLRYKRFSKALTKRYLVYNESVELVEKMEKEKKAILIRPSQTIPIDRFERHFDRLKTLYDLGYQDALCVVDEIKRIGRECQNFRID